VGLSQPPTKFKTTSTHRILMDKAKTPTHPAML
jgi:hypothetical protein